MKKKYFIIGFILIIVTATILFFKFNKKYHIDEVAVLDNYEVILKKASYNDETNTLDVVFQITNLHDYSITINDREHFMLEGLGETQIGNSFHSNLNLVKSKEKVMYTLNYHINKRPNYEIIFYSGIKNNKIKFIIDLKE